MADAVADYINRVVAAAPPLTPAQRDRLSSLLRSEPVHTPGFDDLREVLGE